MIKTFLLDLGDVLVHFSHQRMIEQIADVCQATTASVREFLLDGGVQIQFERGLLSEREFHRRVQAFAHREIEFADLVWAGSDIFWRNESIEPVVASLDAAGYRLVLLSNTCISHVEFVRERFDILALMDDFVLSFDIGSVKPDAAIYEAALRVIQCEPDECFYVDDRPENVAAGREFGLRSHVYRGANELVADLVKNEVRLPGLEHP